MSQQATTVTTRSPAVKPATQTSPIEGDGPVSSSSVPGPDATAVPAETGLAEDTSAERSFTEATLVARAQDGDLDAFTRLVQGHETELFRLAYRMLGDRGDAEDVIQDSLVLSWRKLPTLTDPQAFRSWIYHLATRQCLNVIRGRARRRTDLTSGGDLESSSAVSSAGPDHRAEDPAAAAETSARQRGLDQVLAALPADQRACWVLKELHDLSYPEIAWATGVPVSTVRGRIARARQQLAKGMSAWQ